ncbi:L-lactate dehydrogenase B chain [Drosophila grimshawi]|uniref:L-lactate dehydrogenase B chain n=1 Tax=Drosophila grimshawi TaxID=7222 RepID=UPI000C86FCE6|nr:L-lactate dehydrogenase B chain [Drosophila grimshawi]
MIIKYFTMGFRVARLFKISSIFSRNLNTNCNKDKELWDAFRSCLYKSLKKQKFQPGNKVSIVGTGSVGMSCAITLLSKRITNNIALYDINKKLSNSEHLDLLHGSWFLNDAHIEQCGGKIEATKDSRVVVVTCGPRQKPGESRLDMAQKTAVIIRSIMPDLVKQSPEAVYIVVCNPADVMTWLARKVTNLPYERCFSTGCLLDTARFRLFIAQILGVATSSVYGYILGEHGDSSVPLWSSVTVGGVCLQNFLPTIGTDKDPMQWSTVHKHVVRSAYEVVEGKGYTNWALGVCVAHIVSAIFENSNRIMPLSTNAAGLCGIKEEVFLSLPCIVNECGLCGIVRPILSNWEKTSLKKSADKLLEAQHGIQL